MNDTKTAIENINRRFDQAEERICDIEDRNFESIQSEERKKKELKE